MIPSELGGPETFDELVEPNFGDEPYQDNGIGVPQTGPDGEGVLTVPQRERVVHLSHQQWLHTVYSKVYSEKSE